MLYPSLYELGQTTEYNHIYTRSPIIGQRPESWTTHISLGNQKVRKLLKQKCQDSRGSKAFVSAIFKFVKIPTRYEWSNIRGTVQ